MSDIDALIKKRMAEIEQIQEEFELEDVQEIVELVKHYFEQLPTSRIFTEDKKFTRALSFASADLAPEGGREKIEIAILAYTRPKDWNQAEREAILESWEKGVVAQQKLIDEHKVMRIKTREGYKAVSEIEELALDDKGVPQVIKGRILEGEEQPIPRDHLAVQGKGENTWENKHQGYALGEKWAMNVYGLTHDGEKDIKVEGNIYTNYDGDWATPGSDDFLLKNAPAFGFYDATVIVDDEKSTEHTIIIKSLSAITPKEILITEDVKEVKDDGSIEVKTVERPLEFIEYVYGVMEGQELDDGSIYAPIRDFKEYLATEDADEREELAKNIFMVESKDFPEFHDLYANRDKDGKPIRAANKNKNNYMTWGKYALGVMVCKQVKETKNGNDQLVLIGSAGKRLNAFMPAEHPKITLEKSAEVLISFNTTKKGTRYDKESKKQVNDMINGDIQINNIMGYLPTFELMD